MVIPAFEENGAAGSAPPARWPRAARPMRRQGNGYFRRRPCGDENGRVKGILVNAYEPDAAALTQEMVRKLATHPEG